MSPIHEQWMPMLAFNVTSARALRCLPALSLILLGACSILPRAAPENPSQELVAVPFFPQTIHQCGPAALATVLNWSGASTTPEALAPQVYIPGRQGSLAVEMVAATRRAGRVPYPLPADAQALFAEVRAGTPVLVLQDLGAAWIRRWHFAVVIGVDAERDVVILRSGKERRRIERTARFLYSWERGGRWAIVTLPPERLPATVPAATVVRTLDDSARALSNAAVASAYAAAATRWPADPTVLLAAANEAYAGARLVQAEQLYRQLLAVAPGDVPGRNNYANLLLDRGCPAAAAAHARVALTALATDSAFRTAVEETLGRATAAQATASGAPPAEHSPSSGCAGAEPEAPKPPQPLATDGPVAKPPAG